MEGRKDVVGELVNWSEEAKKLSEGGADGDGEASVPDEELDNGGLSDLALFPGNAGMEKVGDEGSNHGANEAGEPEEIVVSDDEVCKDGVEDIIKKCNTETDKEITGGVMRPSGVLRARSMLVGRRSMICRRRSMFCGCGSMICGCGSMFVVCRSMMIVRGSMIF